MEREPIHAGEVTSARLDPEDERRFWQGVEGAARFFMGDSDVQRALERLVGTLEAQKIPYAIVGAMALNEFGYRRVTVDVDVLLTPAGLEALKAATLGRGYVEKFPGSRGVRHLVSLTNRRHSGQWIQLVGRDGRLAPVVAWARVAGDAAVGPGSSQYWRNA